jgi:hypothetical protein
MSVRSECPALRRTGLYSPALPELPSLQSRPAVTIPHANRERDMPPLSVKHAQPDYARALRRVSLQQFSSPLCENSTPLVVWSERAKLQIQGSAGMPLADGFRDSDYLVRRYIDSVQALMAFEQDGNVKALAEAAAIICDALTMLSKDESFWNQLTQLSGPIGENQRSIREALDELDLFLKQELKVLREYGIPESVTRRLLFDLSTSLKAFGANPTPQLLVQLQQDLPDAVRMICALSPPQAEDEETILDTSLKAREGLAVLGGVVTVVANGVTSFAAPIALCSIVGGLASSLGFLAWMKRKKG